MIEEIILKNNSTGDSVLMDMQASPFILDSVDLGTISATHNTSKFVNQIGEFLENSTLDIRSIAITGYVVGETFELIKDRKSVLSRMVNPLEDMCIFVDEYRLDFKADSTIKYSVSYKENNEVLCKFLISGKAIDPLFSDENDRVKIVSNTVGKFHFPLTIPKKSGIIMGEKNNSLIATILNNGQVDVGMTIVIEAKASVVNPIIINVETQEFIKLDYTMSARERIVIVTSDGKESVRGNKENEQESNYFCYWNFDSSWLKLKVGKTMLRYNAEEDTISNMEVIVYYSQKYLEVQ